MSRERTSAARSHPGDRAILAAAEEHRQHLLNVAYRMLGSFSEAEDMVQESYLRLLRADRENIEDVRGWLVVVVTRICLDHLRSARSRRETNMGPWLPEPIVRADGDSLDPADIVMLDESVRMGLLIMLERLTPAERVVFVLHDVFQYSFEEIGPMVDRAPAACRQLASRARRRISADTALTRAPVDPEEMRRAAERFIAACSGADLQAFLEVLDPDVVGWVDLGEVAVPLSQPSTGSAEVASRAMRLFGPASRLRLEPAEVNGESGVVASLEGKPWAVLVLAVRDGLITAIYSIADQRKLTRLARR